MIKTLTIGIIICILLVAIVFAINIQNKNVEEGSEPLNKENQGTSENIEFDSNYINYKGKISELEIEGQELSIVVEGEDKNSGFKAIKFNIIDKTIIVSDESRKIVGNEKLEKGMNVEVSFPKDSPMSRSLPPMTNAKVLVINQAKENTIGVKVDHFNKELVSADNLLKLNITKDTIIEDQNGKKLREEDLYNKDLIVFYGPATTMSIPGQSNAVKIIALIE